MKSQQYIFKGIHSSMPIGRYACNVRGCAQYIQEMILRNRDTSYEVFHKQMVKAKLLIELYDEIIIQKDKSIIAMRWFYIVREDIKTLREIVNTHQNKNRLLLIK